MTGTRGSFNLPWVSLIKKMMNEWENGDVGAQKALENIPTLGITRTRDLKGSPGTGTQF